MITRYRRVLARRGVQNALIIGFLIRTPIFAAAVVLTLHVVSTLRHSYTAAGLLSASATLAIAVSAPWRGRLLDRHGLRRSTISSIVIAAGCWSIAPFSSYWVLLVLGALAGLFALPVFSVVRLMLIAATEPEDRQTVIALDGSAVELSFMAGPALGVWAATQWSTTWVLFGLQMAAVAAGIVLWSLNPQLKHGDSAESSSATPRGAWLRPPFVMVCLVAAATTLVLGGSDLAIVAALREFGSAPSIGMVLAVWGLGSLLGGLIYGGLSRSFSAFGMLGVLALTTAPMALASGAVSLAALAFLAGLLCAPTITATVEAVSRIVPENSLGEALGWHGSCMTAGMALGAPLAGAVIDQRGPPAGFLVLALAGVVVALLGGGALAARRRVGVPS